MKHRLGFWLMCLGVLLVVSAACLHGYNIWDDNRAASVSAATLEILHQQIEVKMQEQDGEASPPDEIYPKDVEIDGEKYIGILKIPALGLELPINKEWSYPKLKESPCRYSGDISDSLTIAAHSYKNHFGYISGLKHGDTISIIDVSGYENSYYVDKKVILLATDIDEMVNSDYDLSLFTCTYGGKDRITIRCMRANQPFTIY